MDHDGQVSAEEMQTMVEDLINEEDKSRGMQKMALIMAGVVALVVISNIVLVFTVSWLSKDTSMEVRPGTDAAVTTPPPPRCKGVSDLGRSRQLPFGEDSFPSRLMAFKSGAACVTGRHHLFISLLTAACSCTGRCYGVQGHGQGRRGGFL